jgi:hypothetical protein
MMEHDEERPDPERPRDPGAGPDAGPDAGSEAERIARRDDYLWDRSGTPDATVAALEGALAQRRWRGRLGELSELDATVDEDLHDVPGPAPGARPRLVSVPRALAATLIVFALLAVGLSVWHGIMEPEHGDAPVAEAPTVPDVPTAPAAGAMPPVADAPSYRLDVLDGTPRVDGAGVAAGAPLLVGPGAAVETDARSRARVHVGDIGSVELGPTSRLRVGAPSAALAPDAGYLLHLDRGSLTASIFAAPRLFQLGTPSGMAVDMGCIYTAEVDMDGSTRLRVDLGQVSFETEGRKVLVPFGASTRAWPGVGPGTPVWDDASAEFVAAVARYDELTLRERGAPDRAQLDAALAAVLATERPQDSLTLWHLLAHARADAAAPVYERLAALLPPPAGVTREACLAGDGAALLAWRDALGWAWDSGTRSKPGR